jgi:putative ABC transport system permease protein
MGWSSSLPFSLRMAWRQTRFMRGKLLLLALTISLGVASLVACGSFSAKLRLALESQALELLGGDLLLRASRAPTPELEALLADLPGQRTTSVHFASMAHFPESSATRLVRLSAVEPDFPLYGSVQCEPESALAQLAAGPFALVDEGLMRQLQLQPGQRLEIGRQRFTIAGSLSRLPGEAPMASALGPRLLIPASFLEQTRLIAFGSRIEYELTFRLPATLAPSFLAEWLKEKQAPLGALQWRVETPEERKRALGQTFDYLETFLVLAGLSSLLLGVTGIAGAVSLLIRSQRRSLAILRCLGGSAKDLQWIPLLQALALTSLGVFAGTLFGLVVQKILPPLVADFLPLNLPGGTPLRPVLWSALICLLFALPFALQPLHSFVHASPLALFRPGLPGKPGPVGTRRTLILWSLSLLLALPLVLTNKAWLAALLLTLVLLALAILWALSRFLLRLLAALVPSTFPFPLRMAIAYLRQADNTFALAIAGLGLVGFLMVSHWLVSASILEKLRSTSPSDRPNLILFDIQPDQVSSLQGVLATHSAQAGAAIPMVTMRLLQLKGKPIRHWMAAEQPAPIPDWAALWEYRSSYRPQLHSGETLLRGVWQGRWDGVGPVPISLEEGIARTLRLDLGDDLLLDVQGLSLAARVASIRKVEWQSLQPNFYLLFPTGVLEDAPSMFIQAVSLPSAELPVLQNAIFQSFPNVSSVNLTLLLALLDGVLAKVEGMLLSMSFFFLLTALLLLVSAMINQNQQRSEDHQLLVLLGATNGQIRLTQMGEQGILGLSAAMAALLLAYPAAWLICHFLLEIPLQANLHSAALVLAVSCTLTVVLGLATHVKNMGNPRGE